MLPTTVIFKDFVDWDNKEYLLEMTEQEQGVDLYHLLQKHLCVPEHMHHLQGQLQGLYTIANVEQGNKLNRIAIGVSIVAIWLAFVAILVDVTLNVPNFYPDSRDNFDWMGDNMAFFIIIYAVVTITLVKWQWGKISIFKNSFESTK